MAEFKKLPDAIAGALARKGSAYLARSLPNDSLGAADGVGELAESIEIWTLGASSLLEATALGLPRLAKKTGRWHHQIRVDGNTTAWMRSKALGPNPEDWVVTEACSSELAVNIDHRISQMDNDLDVPGEVRLLVIPAYQIWALWLIKEDGERLMLIVAAPQADESLAIEKEHPLPMEESEFLKWVATLPVVEGLRD